MLFDASEPAKVLENIKSGAFSPFSKKIDFGSKKAPQNEPKIDAEIIKNPSRATKGAPNVDLEYFLAVLWKT